MGYLDSKCKVPSDFGNTARDNLLKYQLDNEVAASIVRTEVADSPDKTSIQIVLYNRNGIEISRTDPITVDAVGNKVVKKLELIEPPENLKNEGEENKLLRITFKGYTETEPQFIYCSLDDIYNKIKANTTAINLKQNKLVDDTTKQPGEIVNIKTINHKSIIVTDPEDTNLVVGGGPGGGTVTEIIAGDGLTGGIITEAGTIAVDYTKVAKVEQIAGQWDVLHRLQTLEDHFASTIYGGYPSVKFSWVTEITTSPVVVRGNKGKVSNPIWVEDNTTYSYNKDGFGYEDYSDNAQFNLVVNCPEGKHPVCSSAGLVWSVEQYKEEEIVVLNTYRLTANVNAAGNFILQIGLEDNI